MNMQAWNEGTEHIFLDGMIESIFILEMRNNSNEIFKLSVLGSKLIKLLPKMPNTSPYRTTKYVLFYDNIFQNHEFLFSRPVCLLK